MRTVAIVAVLLACIAGSVSAQEIPGVPTGQVTTRVVPETVTVGQPFQVTLRAVPPAGRVAVPPPVPDTGGIIEPLDPANVTRRGDTLMVRYRLLAWQPGVLTVPLAPVVMRLGASELSVPVDVRVVVASVLPSDSAGRVPKAPRELFPLTARWWEQWWKWVLGVVLGLVSLYLLHRWRSRDRTVVAGKPSPAGVAETAFARLDARRLPAAGEGGRHVALSAEVVRQYLADIEPSLPLTLTTSELQDAIRHRTSMPLHEIAQLFETVDAVRFGRTPVDAATVQRASGQAREVVRAIERVRTGMPEQAA